MPLKKGHSKEVLHENIQEMIRAGHPVKQAVAASYANQRKYKKMADGGMVEDDSHIEDETGDGHQEDVGELQHDTQSMDGDADYLMLGNALGKIHEDHGYAHGGMVDEEDDDETVAEGGPATPMAEMPITTDNTAEMSAGLSEEQKKALMMKKQKRVFR